LIKILLAIQILLTGVIGFLPLKTFTMFFAASSAILVLVSKVALPM
jgi:hypothetical protein